MRIAMNPPNYPAADGRGRRSGVTASVVICALSLLLCHETSAAGNRYEIDIDATSAPEEAAKVVMRGFVPATKGQGQIAEATLEDGRTILTGHVENIRNVSLLLLKSDSTLLRGARFVLEPGVIRVTFASDQNEVEGGKYTRIAYDSWEQDPEFKAAYARQQALTAEYQALPEEEKVEWRANFETRAKESPQEVYRANLIKDRILEEISASHEDPVARFVALSANDAWYYGPQFVTDAKARAYLYRIERYEALAGELPENLSLAFELERLKEEYRRFLTASSITVGSVIRDFTASTREGEPFRLQDVLAESKYILVEFWASWCGPCRVEIPHMKAVYETYADKGFEIISVSLDEEKEDWDEASIEEEIPWIDVGDQMAFKSDVAKLYGVIGIPANYLVSGFDGKIVAIGLRQEKLERKLTELYGQ